MLVGRLYVCPEFWLYTTRSRLPISPYNSNFSFESCNKCLDFIEIGAKTILSLQK